MLNADRTSQIKRVLSRRSRFNPSGSGKKEDNQWRANFSVDQEGEEKLSGHSVLGEMINSRQTWVPLMDVQKKV